MHASCTWVMYPQNRILHRYTRCGVDLQAGGERQHVAQQRRLVRHHAQAGQAHGELPAGCRRAAAQPDAKGVHGPQRVPAVGLVDLQVPRDLYDTQRAMRV